MSGSTEHPSTETLDALAQGRALDDPAAREHVRECTLCATALRSRLGRGLPGLERLLRRGVLSGEGLSPEERRELAGRTRAWQALGEAERRGAPELLEALLARPAALRRELVRQSPRFGSYELVDHLARAARREGFRDPVQSLELARLSLEVAEALEGAGWPRGVANDGRALAWAGVANAHRIVKELVEAERAMEQARRYLAEGTGEPDLRAEVLSLLGSLRIDEARFDEAVTALEEAAAIYRAHRDRPAEGKVLMQLGNAAGERGETAEAVRCLVEARRLLGADAPGELGLLAAQSLLGWLVADGRAAEARAVLEELEGEARGREMSFYLRQRLPWARARLLWLEGDRAAAESELRAVREAYRGNDEVYRVCLVSLDLATLYLEEGRTGEVRQLARELCTLFLSRQLHRNALQALVLFQRAAETETATVALLRDLSRFLRRASRNPYLVYPGAEDAG